MFYTLFAAKVTRLAQMPTQKSWDSITLWGMENIILPILVLCCFISERETQT